MALGVLTAGGLEPLILSFTGDAYRLQVAVSNDQPLPGPRGTLRSELRVSFV